MRHFRWPTRHALHTLLLAAALAVLLAGCSFGGATTNGSPLPAALVSSVTPAPTGSAGFSTLHITALNPSDGSTRWSYQASWHPWHPAAAPVVANGVVYVTSDTLPAHPTTEQPSGDLTALSERDGHKLWTVHIGFIAATPVVVNGVVYSSGLSVNSAKQMVASFYALRAESGQQIWRKDIINVASSDPAQGIGIFNSIQFVDGALYITSNQLCFDACNAAYLLALRASDGKQLWKVTIPGNLNIQPPVIANGGLYLTVPSVFDDATNSMLPSQLVAYNASDGTARWKAPMGPGAPVDVVGDSVYATSIAKDDPNNPDSAFTITVYALDSATGAARWRFTASSHGTDSLLALLGASANAVYVQSRAGDAYTLSSLSPQDGSVRWHVALQAPIGAPLRQGAPLYALAGALAQQASDHPYANLVALAPTNGHTLWSAPLSPAPRGDIAVTVLASSGDALYAAYHSNTLTAISAHDGSPLWKAAPPGGMVGVTVVS